MGQRHRDSMGLILAIAIAVNGCAAAAPGVKESGPARLRKHPEVVVVHYQHAPPFLLGQPRSVGRAMATSAALAVPLLLLFGPVAPSMGNVLQAHMEKREAEAAGQELMIAIPLEDPVVRVKERLMSALSAENGIGRIRPAAIATESDDVTSLRQALGPATVLDVRTTSWGLHPYQIDSKSFLAHYTVKARLISLDEEKVLWRDEISCVTPGDRRFGAPTLEELKADGGALLKRTMAETAEVCVAPLLASFRGEKPARPVPAPDEPAKITLDPATLARAEDALFGPSGLVEGLRRFEAKFHGLTLTTEDLPRLRTILQRATGSPWRSEVQFRGTLDGVAFKAEMEKGRVGRVEFTFEGLRFDDEAQASAFLVPLQGRGVREVKFVGLAGGLPTELVERPSSTPVSSAAPTRPTGLPEPSRQSHKPVIRQLAHIGDIAGTWIGTVGLPGRPAVPVTMVLRDDGSYETITPSRRFVGSYWITGGKARYRSTTSGRTGTFELRENDGEQLLIIIIDGGGGGELKPASVAPAATSAPVRPAGPETELVRMVGTWTGTMAGPPRSPSDLGLRQDVTLRIFEQGGAIRWEGIRSSSGREVSRGSGTVALSEDGIVLSGQRRDAGSTRAVPVNLTLTRRGRTLEGVVLGRDNLVYTIALTRSR